MPSITTDVDIDPSDIVDWIVDDPDLIVSALDQLIDLGKQPAHMARHAGAAANLARYQAAVEALRSDRFGAACHTNDDDIAVDALIDAFLRFDSINRDRALARLQAIS